MPVVRACGHSAQFLLAHRPTKKPLLAETFVREIASPNGLAERMLEATLDIAERRYGERPDLHRGERTPGIGSPFGETMKAVLLEDPVFEEAPMNPALLALTTYLCGYDVVLSSLSSVMKGLGETDRTRLTLTLYFHPCCTRMMRSRGPDLGNTRRAGVTPRRDGAGLGRADV